LKKQIFKIHLETVDGVRYFDKLGSILLGFDISMFANNDGSSVASSNLLQSVNAFLQKKKTIIIVFSYWDCNQIKAYHIDRIAGSNHNKRHQFVDQGKRAVLQFSGQKTLTVHVRQFLDFL